MTRTKKRSLFAIDVSDEQLAAKTERKPATKARNAPMAAAVKENFAALNERDRLDQQIRRENDELAHEFVRLRELGLITELVPIDAITNLDMPRDRAVGEDAELAELKLSIRDIGLSNPIRVHRSGQGAYKLVQGARRLNAFRALYDESTTAEERDRWAKIPAAYFSSSDDLATSYRQMVDENLIRKEISFGEMAQLAMRYAADPATPENDLDTAVATLFKSTSYSKRSNIRAFGHLLEMLGASLKYPQAIARNLGLEVRKKLTKQPALIEPLIGDIKGANTMDAEQAILQNFVSNQSPKSTGKQSVNDTAKEFTWTFKLGKSEGQLKGHRGRQGLVIKGAPIAAMDPGRLSQALDAFARALDAK